MYVYLVYSPPYKDILIECGARVLVNYAYAPFSALGREVPSGFKSVIIDSGVFQLQTGLKREHEISVGGYCQWLHFQLASHPEIDGYFAYDWDGGKGEGTTRERISKSNYDLMRSMGLTPIPVWHPLFEGRDLLQYYTEQTDYVALGGLTVASYSSKAAPLLAACKLKYPSHRFHVLGVGHPLINKMPTSLLPYSIDVSTWSAPARFGTQVVRLEDGRIVETAHGHDRREGGVEALRGGIRDNLFLRESIVSAVRTLMSMETLGEGGGDRIQPLLI